MDQLSPPKLAKWPFFLGDLLLLSFAGLVIYLSSWPLGPWVVGASGIAVLTGAWLAVTPFLWEYRALLKGTEIEALVSTLGQLQKLEQVSGQIANATSQWQSAHELAEKTVQTAKAVTTRMTAETTAFTEFLQKANDVEKNHLRLEVDKLRRSEGDWLKITTATLDHVYALHEAGVRSGQAGLIAQLSHFQDACRDVARRVGLVPFAAAIDEPFNPLRHQLLDLEATPPAEGRVSQCIATGYTYQGQLLRHALVVVQTPSQPVTSSEPALPQPLPADEPELGQPVPVSADTPVPIEPTSPEPAPYQPIPAEEPEFEQSVPASTDTPAPIEPPSPEPAPIESIPATEPEPEQPVAVSADTPAPIEPPSPEPAPPEFIPADEPEPEQPVPASADTPAPSELPTPEPASPQPIPADEPELGQTAPPSADLPVPNEPTTVEPATPQPIPAGPAMAPAEDPGSKEPPTPASEPSSSVFRRQSQLPL